MKLKQVRKTLMRLRYSPLEVGEMIDGLVRVLHKFVDAEGTMEAFEKGFPAFVTERFSTQQFEAFLRHIDPEFSMLWRDFKEEEVYAPIDESDEELILDVDRELFEEERLKYTRQAIEDAKKSHAVLAFEQAFIPLFGVKRREGKLPPTGAPPTKYERPKLVMTPTGGQPGYKRH